MNEIVILVGAGATLADAVNRSPKYRPPLDRGFFSGVRRAGEHTAPDIVNIAAYLRNYYAMDLFDESTDSFERVLAIIYADIYGGPNQSVAESAFRAMLRALHRRIVRTTNNLDSGKKSHLYRIIVKLLNDGVAPEEITLITYNYDVQAEKVLRAIASTRRWGHLTIWAFPGCYGLSNFKTSGAPDSVEKFPRSTLQGGIAVLKLHGSLNWFSKHISKDPTASTLLNPRRELWITPRVSIEPGMSFKSPGRRMYTFPIIVPPVTNKAAIIHSELRAVWQKAQNALESARQILVFGYSCPVSDSETANMVSRTCRSNSVLEDFSIIDPAPLVFNRYVEVTGLDRLSYFRWCTAYLEAS